MAEAITGPAGQDMSIRAEVGLLSRNIRIVGSQDVAGTDSFGAHVQMLHIDEAHLRYVTQAPRAQRRVLELSSFVGSFRRRSFGDIRSASYLQASKIHCNTLDTTSNALKVPRNP